MQYFVRSFPTGPSTTEKTEASGEEDLMVLIVKYSGEKVEKDRIGESIIRLTTDNQCGRIYITRSLGDF